MSYYLFIKKLYRGVHKQNGFKQIQIIKAHEKNAFTLEEKTLGYQISYIMTANGLGKRSMEKFRRNIIMPLIHGLNMVGSCHEIVFDQKFGIILPDYIKQDLFNINDVINHLKIIIKNIQKGWFEIIPSERYDETSTPVKEDNNVQRQPGQVEYLNKKMESYGYFNPTYTSVYNNPGVVVNEYDSVDYE